MEKGATRVATLLLLAAGVGLAGAAAAQPAPLVERLEIAGNRLLPAETFLYYVSTRPGEPYAAQRLAEDFRRLWSTGLLEDLQLDVADGPGGKRVVFHVVERKQLRSVEYRGSRELKPEQVEAELQRRKLAFRLDGLYDPAQAMRVDEALREALARRGHAAAGVRHETRDAGPVAVDLVFTIDDGPKSRVEQIVFTGSTAFSQRRLRRALENLEPASFWNLTWLRDKSAYSPEKWSGGGDDPLGDRARVEELYRSHGYVTAEIGDPRLVPLEGGSRDVRRLRLEIPVREGVPYRVGEVRFEGLSLLGEPEARALYGLSPGDLYDESRLRKGSEALRDLYGRRGYVQVTVGVTRNPDPATRRVDVLLKVDEDVQYFVGRIRFTGNHTTRDKVARREVVLNEGELFDTDALKASVRRLDQTGFFKPMRRPPEIAANASWTRTLDVTFPLQEESPTRFSLGGGASGAEGAYLNGNFATTNFLGLGETFQLTAQNGTLTRVYELGLSKPYFLDRPLTAGFQVFQRRQTYRTTAAQGVQGYRDQRTGASLLAGIRVARWSRLSVGYSYQVVELSLRDASGLDSAAVVNAISPADVGRRHQSTLSPSLVRDTTEDGFMPRRGTRLGASVPVSGGPLGGTLDFFKPRLEAVAHLPHGSRGSVGLRAEAGFLLPFGDSARSETAGRGSLPVYERFFLGGETQIRGYDYRTVGPRDAANRAIGGNKYLLLNAEYSLELLRPLHLVLFLDAGQAYAEGDGFDLGRLRVSTGAELRAPLPLLKVPLRLIYAWNRNRDPSQPPHAFKFAIGTAF